MMRKPNPKRHIQRGIPILPSLFTTGNLFCGYYSIIATLQGNFSHAALAIGIAMVADGLDGRIARMTNTTSAFGGAFDSLADVLTFGMAPAALMFSWSLSGLDRIGWMTAFFFLTCSATRLARFTVHTSNNDRRYFAGLPAPPAAGMLAALAFYAPQPDDRPAMAYGVVVLIVILSLLMISKVRYRSFKDIDMFARRPYPLVALLAIGFAVVANAPQTILLMLAAIYVASGPTDRIFAQMRRQWSNEPDSPAVPLDTDTDLDLAATEPADDDH